MSKPIYQIVAVARNGVIGLNRKLPWRIPEEWNYFINTTAHGVMVMGRVCAEEFGQGMTDRDMVAITHDENFRLPGFLVAHSIEDSIAMAETSPQPGPIWICGGEDIYKDTFAVTSRLYISFIQREFEGDTYFPKDWNKMFPHLLSQQDFFNSEIPYSVCVYGKESGQL